MEASIDMESISRPMKDIQVVGWTVFSSWIGTPMYRHRFKNDSRLFAQMEDSGGPTKRKSSRMWVICMIPNLCLDIHSRLVLNLSNMAHELDAPIGRHLSQTNLLFQKVPSNSWFSWCIGMILKAESMSVFDNMARRPTSNNKSIASSKVVYFTVDNSGHITSLIEDPFGKLKL